MKRNLLFLIAALLFSSLACFGQNDAEYRKETYIYSIKEGDTLRLDKYDLLQGGEELRPCIVFMFGGGFTHGARDEQSYLPFFEFLASEGYVVASIDYRLGFSGARLGQDAGPVQFMMAFMNTLEMAVEDLFDATSYIVGKAGAWGIDPDMIISCGSSAGAVSVLQGEYAVVVEAEQAKRLPEGFNYAGVISFAGAVFSVDGLKGEQAPCPIMLFHGDADRNVPYDKIEEMGAGFYGSKYIAGELHKNGYPYWFYDVENAGHEWATVPMTSNREEILKFLDDFVKARMPLMSHTFVEATDGPAPDKDFELMDYIEANFGQ